MYQIQRTAPQGNYSFTEIEDNEEMFTFTFNYNRWAASGAQAFYLGQNIHIRKKNFLSSKHAILKDGIEEGRITFDWRMTAAIQLYESDRVFVLKRKGIGRKRFELICVNPNVLVLTIKRRFDLKKFRVKYKVNVVAANQQMFDIPELIIYCMYAMRRHARKRGHGL